MRELGCSYWAITDHSRSSVQANGLAPERVREQLAKIREINRRFEGEGDSFRLLTGSEVDILAEGKLDFDDGLLGQLFPCVVHKHITRDPSI